jgi:hypothetical protein
MWHPVCSQIIRKLVNYINCMSSDFVISFLNIRNICLWTWKNGQSKYIGNIMQTIHRTKTNKQMKIQSETQKTQTKNHKSHRIVSISVYDKPKWIRTGFNCVNVNCETIFPICSSLGFSKSDSSETLMSALLLTNTLSWNWIVLAHWHNNRRKDMSFVLDGLFWFRTNQSPWFG